MKTQAMPTHKHPAGTRRWSWAAACAVVAMVATTAATANTNTNTNTRASISTSTSTDTNTTANTPNHPPKHRLASATVAMPFGHIDQTEVSIAAFERFATQTGLRTQAEQAGGGFEFVGGWQRRAGWTWRAPNGQAQANPALPAVHLTHTEAQAYCQWAGGELPTYEQWRQAAYTELRPNPPPDFVRGQTYAYPTGASSDGANTSGADPWPTAAPVGHTRAGVNGLYDMGGNVWEWTNTAQDDSRQTAGSSWWYPAANMRADLQAFKPKDFYAVYIGFRCVYPRPAGLARTP
jgi:formylglycine-generating enzyme